MKEGHASGSVGAWRRMAVVSLMMVLVFVLAACSAGSGDNANGSSSMESTSDASAPAKMEVRTDSDSSKNMASEALQPIEKEKKGGQRGYANPQQVQQAGQLTAGEWDDLSAWERFGNLLNSAEGDNSMQVWRFEQFARLEVSVSAKGKAISDAEVTLYSGKDIAWQARTNTEGKAYVFAGMFTSGAAQGDYTVQVRSGQASKTTGALQIPQQGSIKVDLGDSQPISTQVDLMFLVDTTGSMEDELNYLEAELKDVVGRVSDATANQLPLRISANFYRDQHDEYVVRSNPFTTDVNEVITEFSKQSAKGGGDYPEAVEAGLHEAIHDHEWSKEARARLLFLVLDAPPRDEPQIIDEMHQLIQTAAQKGIRIIPVAASGTNEDTEYLLRFMAVATGGTYLFLTDDSGIGGDHLEPAVGEFEVKKLNDQLVEVINRYVKQ